MRSPLRKKLSGIRVRTGQAVFTFSRDRYANVKLNSQEGNIRIQLKLTFTISASNSQQYKKMGKTYVFVKSYTEYVYRNF